MSSARGRRILLILQKRIPPIFNKNQIVIDHQVPQSKATELDPAANNLYRVKDVQPKNLRLISIIDGTERTLPIELVRPMNIPDLMNMRYSLNHHYLNSQFNRLAKNNRYIGPDAAKTWRRITMKNKTKDAQQEEHEVQDTKPEKQEEAEPHPDMFRRITRSGTAFLATVSPLHSIL